MSPSILVISRTRVYSAVGASAINSRVEENSTGSVDFSASEERDARLCIFLSRYPSSDVQSRRLDDATMTFCVLILCGLALSFQGVDSCDAETTNFSIISNEATSDSYRSYKVNLYQYQFLKNHPNCRSPEFSRLLYQKLLKQWRWTQNRTGKHRMQILHILH